MCVHPRPTWHERLSRLYGRGDSRYGHVLMPRIRQAHAQQRQGHRQGRQRCRAAGGADAIARRRQRTTAVAAARGRAAGRGASGSLRPGSSKPRRLDRPSMAARGDRVGRGHVRGAGWPRGDRAHDANHPKAVSCTNFKAPIKTKRLRLILNLLHYAKKGLLGYQTELKHDTFS